MTRSYMYILYFGGKQKALFCSDEASRAALGWDQETPPKKYRNLAKKKNVEIEDLQEKETRAGQ